MQYLSKSVEETNKIALDFVKQIYKKNKNNKAAKAIVVGLFGDLGSGKTTFTQAVGKILGVAEVMTSPTFVIEKRYAIPQSTIYNLQFTNLIHIDAYRLDRVSGALPENIIRVNFKFISEFEREIEL